MSNIVIIGKDLPDNLELAEELAAKNRTVFITSKSENETSNFESEKIFASTWNKASAISAHSLIIKAETKLGSIDEVLFYFDAYNYASKFEVDKTEEVASAVDVMINSYLYSAFELIKRIDQRKENIIVSFLLKEYPSKYNNILSKTTGVVPANTLVSAASNAFISLAESFSTAVSERNYLSVLLGKCSFNSDIYKSEKAIADWLADSIDTIRNSKKEQTIKQSTVWNKVGGTVKTGFSLFSR